MTQTPDDPFFISVHSREIEIDQVCDQLIHTIHESMQARNVDMLLIFATAEYADDFEELALRFKDAFDARVQLGHTVRGVFTNQQEFEKGPAISVFAASLPGVALHPFVIRNADYKRFKDNVDLIKDHCQSDAFIDENEQTIDPAAILFFADPFTCPLLHILPWLKQTMPDVPVMGGVSSSAAKAGDNRLIFDNRVLTQGGVGVSIGQQVNVIEITCYSCRPIGRPWVVTQSEKNIIRELGGLPVMDIVKQTAVESDDHTRALIENGLYVGRVINEYRDTFEPGDFVIRNLIGFDPDQQMLATSDYFRPGQTIQFQVDDAEFADMLLRETLEKQLDHLRGYGDDYSPNHFGLLINSSHHRGNAFFHCDHHETSLIRKYMGNIPLSGYFASGEISSAHGRHILNAHTSSMTLFTPRKPD